MAVHQSGFQEIVDCHWLIRLVDTPGTLGLFAFQHLPGGTQLLSHPSEQLLRAGSALLCPLQLLPARSQARMRLRLLLQS